MRDSKVLTRFTRLNNGNLAILAHSVFSSMSHNTNFPAPVPALGTLGTAITGYTTALAYAKNGSEMDTAIKAQKEKDLEDILYDLALYVKKVSNSDAAIMLSSGFKISKQPSPVGPLAKPENFTITSEGKGEIKLRIKIIYGASVYQWEYRQLRTAEWTSKTSTKSTIILTGLESGKQYQFRVVPVGYSDIREYSDVISSFVL